MDGGQHEISNCSWVLFKIHLPNPNSSEAKDCNVYIYLQGNCNCVSFYLCCTRCAAFGRRIRKKKRKNGKDRKMKRIKKGTYKEKGRKSQVSECSREYNSRKCN